MLPGFSFNSSSSIQTLKNDLNNTPWNMMFVSPKKGKSMETKSKKRESK